eukprot:evm.model.scf_394.1 EVM.evm.TU.scf_394.1   scf_394:12902-20036(+)
MPALLAAGRVWLLPAVGDNARHARPPAAPVGRPGSRAEGKRRRKAVAAVSTVGGSAACSELTEFGFLKGFDEKFKLADLIGKGSYASVYLGFDRVTGERFAIKSLPKRYRGKYLTEYFVGRIHHEVDVYTSLGSSLNIAYLYGVYETPQAVNMVIELCTGGQLWGRIKKGRYSEKDAAKIVKEILRAVAQCHAKNVVVRDVKPENFLFRDRSEDSVLKAIDFGLAEYCSPEDCLKERCGSPIYIAPEVLLRNYGQKCDLWSTGVLAYQLLTGRLPFSGDEGFPLSQQYMDKQMFTNKQAFRAVLYGDLDFVMPPWDELSPQAMDFVKSLLQREPEKRPTAEQALEHEWLSEGEGGASTMPLNASLVQRLQRFGTYGRLKQAALRKVAEFVATDGQLVEDLAKAFHLLDTSDTGRVSYTDISNELRKGEFDLSDPEIDQLLAQMEVDADDCIDYPSWLAAVVDWRQIQDSAQWDKWVVKAFKVFDQDQSGSLSTDELTHMLCGDVCEIPDTVPAALREADANGDGCITLDEFIAVMRIDRGDRLDLFESRRRRNGS